MPPIKPTTKSPIDFSIANINRQLKQAFDFSPQELTDIRDFAQSSLLLGAKLKRSKNEQLSEIDIQNDEASTIISDTAYPNSLLNHEGHIYLFLSKKVYREDLNKNGPNSVRGFRYGTLAIDLTDNNALVFIKITEYSNTLFEGRYSAEFKPEAELSKKYADATHNTPALRKTPNNTTKIYTITPYKGIETFALIVENQLTFLQIMYLAIQYMLVVYTQLKDKNLVHRDLKPQNYTAKILPNGLLDVFVIDFGLVKEMTTDAETHHSYFLGKKLVGNKLFTPELLKCNSDRYYSTATDLFAAACSANQILDNSIDIYNGLNIDSPERQLFDGIGNLIDAILDENTFRVNNKFIANLDEDEIKCKLEHLTFNAEKLILEKKSEKKLRGAVFNANSPQGVCDVVTPSILRKESESIEMERELSSPPPPAPSSPPPPAPSAPPQRSLGFASPACFFQLNQESFVSPIGMGVEANDDCIHPIAVGSPPK